MLIKSIVDQSS